jgi:regulator of replication initiation timing
VALSRKRDLELVLQRNIDCIAELKSRIMEYELENDTVAVENEELRRFSMNGYQIAKNV